MNNSMHFTEGDWERIAFDWSAWWEGELNRSMVVIENPVYIRKPQELSREFLLEKPVDQVLEYYQAQLEKRQVFGDAWPKWLPFFGAGVVAAFLGADLHCSPETETIWFEHADPTKTGAESEGIDLNNVWWKRIKALTEAAVDFWGDRVCIGFTDLGGNMDILASLQTSQSLLLELYDSPEIVKRKSDEITNIWLQYYDELSEIILETGRGTTPWAPIWTPGRCYMLQSDFSAMISPEMFEKFVVPDLITCCERIDHTFYHLDGKGQINHLDILLLLGSLDGIQWIPGEGQQSPASWLPLLKCIIDAGKLCQLYVSAKDARIIVRELGGRGFAFYITDTLDPDEANSLLMDLTSEKDRN